MISTCSASLRELLVPGGILVLLYWKSFVVVREPHPARKSGPVSSGAWPEPLRVTR